MMKRRQRASARVEDGVLFARARTVAANQSTLAPSTARTGGHGGIGGLVLLVVVAGVVAWAVKRK